MLQMNEKILIVDDDVNICELLRLYLTKEGYFKKITLQSLRGNDEQKCKDGDEILNIMDGENTDKLGVKFREKLGFMPQYPGMYPSFSALNCNDDFRAATSSIFSVSIALALGGNVTPQRSMRRRTRVRYQSTSAMAASRSIESGYFT